MNEQPLVISHEIAILGDCTRSLRVHGHQVDSSVFSNLATVPSVLDSGSFLAFLKLIDDLNVCVGQPDSRFIELLQQKSNEIVLPDGSRSAYIDDSACVHYNDQCYSATVRT